MHVRELTPPHLLACAGADRVRRVLRCETSTGRLRAWRSSFLWHVCVRRVCAHLSCCVGWRISCWRVIGACERRPGVISVYSVIRISNRIQVGSASGKTRRAGAPKNIARGKWRIILNRHMQREIARVFLWQSPVCMSCGGCLVLSESRGPQQWYEGRARTPY